MYHNFVFSVLETIFYAFRETLVQRHLVIRPLHVYFIQLLHILPLHQFCIYLKRHVEYFLIPVDAADRQKLGFFFKRTVV